MDSLKDVCEYALKGGKIVEEKAKLGIVELSDVLFLNKIIADLCDLLLKQGELIFRYGGEVSD